MQSFTSKDIVTETNGFLGKGGYGDTINVPGVRIQAFFKDGRKSPIHAYPSDTGKGDKDIERVAKHFFSGYGQIECVIVLWGDGILRSKQITLIEGKINKLPIGKARRGKVGRG